MHRIWPAICTLLCVSAVIGRPASAESLWQPQTTNSPFADKRAAKVGDIVTVIIVESATAASSASTNAKKDSESELGPGQGPLLEKIPLFSFSGNDSFKGSGATSRTSKFVAKITATVTRVDEHGNLEIEGVRSVQTNKEKEEIRLLGTIRKEDIASDNTILSTYIANASIRYVGNGPIGSRQKEGLLSKLFGILF